MFALPLLCDGCGEFTTHITEFHDREQYRCLHCNRIQVVLQHYTLNKQATRLVKDKPVDVIKSRYLCGDDDVLK